MVVHTCNPALELSNQRQEDYKLLVIRRITRPAWATEFLASLGYETLTQITKKNNKNKLKGRSHFLNYRSLFAINVMKVLYCTSLIKKRIPFVPKIVTLVFNISYFLNFP